jgi:two-component system sensor histidine kinase RegB
VVRLRWCAVFGQLLTVLISELVLGLSLPVIPLLLLIGVTAGSNIWLRNWLREVVPIRPADIGTILVADTVILTGMLSLSGGYENPFAILYFLHVAMAALSVSTIQMWGIAGLTLICYVSLIWVRAPLDWPDHYSPTQIEDLFLVGRVLAYVLTGALLGFFAARLAHELRDRDQRLAEARLKEERHQRLAALATLSAGVAHELGSPLGSIAIVSKELKLAAQRGQTNSESFIQDAEVIRKEVSRCQQILEKLSDRATGNIGDSMETFGFEDLVDDVQKKLNPDYRARFEAVNELHQEEIFAPRQSLVEALVLLVKNAFQASGEQGAVVLRLRGDLDTLKFAVEDSGTGMAPDVLRRASEPFFTTKSPGQGMGLGLFLVRTLAERLNGDLDIKSVAGTGTTVIFSIPRETEDEEMPPEQPAEQRRH